MSLLNNHKKQIDQHTVISFDIFDTLLLRPYVKPTDLFLHLEQLEKAGGFADERITAERRARKIHSNKKDITIDEIYEEIDGKYKHLKQKEMDLERQVLQPNPEIKEIYDYAKAQGKRILIISDMYLPAAFLTKVLHEKGFAGFEKLYVSGEHGKTKGSGHLYQQVLMDLNIKPKTMLHIGDNAHSDKKQAERYGITTLQCTKAIDKLFARNERAKKLYEKHPDNLAVSVLLGLLALPSYPENYWQDFGYQYAGPVILGYMQWLEKQLRKDNISEVMFLARDGYTLEKVFNLIKTANFKTHYFYAPRNLNLAINLNYQYDTVISATKGGRSVSIVLDYYKNKNDFLRQNTPQIKSPTEGLLFIHNNQKLYRQLAQKEKEMYARYLYQFKLTSKQIAMVDTVSGNLSAQKVLLTALPDKQVKGYYWWTLEHYLVDILNYQTQTFQNSHKSEFTDWNLMELFMTAPTPPVEKIDNGQVIFKQPNEHEKKRMEIYPDLSQGAVNFAEKYLQVFGKNRLDFPCEILTDWVNILCEIPTVTDKAHFASMYHAWDIEHTQWRPMPRTWFTSSQDGWEEVIQKKKIYVLGLPLFKFRATASRWRLMFLHFIELAKYKHSLDKKRFYLLGLQLWKIKKKANKTKFYLLKIPLVCIKTK